MLENKKIGLLGGSFNPAHEGHLHISIHAADRLELDEIWWLVSPQNPLKPVSEMASLENRVISAEKIAKDPRIRVSTIEKELGTQYTIDTINALKKRFPQHKFIWLMGADNLSGFEKWKNWQDIFKTIPIAVLAREPYTKKALESEAANLFRDKMIAENKAKELVEINPPAWVYLKIPTHPASSTEIRKAL